MITGRCRLRILLADAVVRLTVRRMPCVEEKSDAKVSDMRFTVIVAEEEHSRRRCKKRSRRRKQAEMQAHI